MADNYSSHVEKADGTVGNGRRSSVVQATEIDMNTVALDDDVFRRMSVAIPNLEQVTGQAKDATDMEHDMTAWEAVKLYPKAVVFSAVMSLAIVMEGYDTALLGSFYGLPQFNQRFGIQLSDGTYQVTAPWQSGLQNGAAIGEILGLMVGGLLADRFGYKPVILGALIMVIGCIFLLFFAQNIGMLFAGEVLCGLPWGAFQTLTTTYAADVTPIKLRPILTTYVNLCWVMGQFISAGVLRAILSRPDQWAWRIPYAIQWIWPVPIIIGILFAPESPWWLVRHGRMDDARKSLRRLTSAKITDEQLDNTLNMIALTNEHEKQASAGTTYADCFKGVNLRRTEISCAVWVIQVWTGIWFGGNVVYFLEQAGFDPAKAFDFGLGTNALAFCGTIASWWLMPLFGRRFLYLFGLATMLSILLAVGFMGIPQPTTSLGYASGGLLMLFVFTYDLTVGPVCYCLVAEIPSTRLRVKTVVLARNAYNVASIIANELNPPILNPSAWNLRGKGGFVWAGFCTISFVWSFFRLPEPKGLAPAEIDVLFEQKVPARKFKKTQVDPFRSVNLTAGTESDEALVEESSKYAPEKV